MALVLNILAALAFTGGGVCMKLSEGLTRTGPAVGVYALFAVGATCQGVAMRRAELGVAYLFVLGLETLLAFAIGLCCFGESRAARKFLGAAAIVAGLVLLRGAPAPSSAPPPGTQEHVP